MRSVFTLILSFLVLFATEGIAQKMPGLDKSPADITYFRTDDGVMARVIYSRPQMNGRAIFGELIPYGKIWRLGANEATVIKLYQDATVGGEKVAAGEYALFATPGEKEWEFVLNSQADQWGAYRMDASKNVASFKVPAGSTEGPVEAFTMMFKEVDGGAHLVAAWDNTMVEVPVKF